MGPDVYNLPRPVSANTSGRYMTAEPGSIVQSVMHLMAEPGPQLTHITFMDLIDCVGV